VEEPESIMIENKDILVDNKLENSHREAQSSAHFGIAKTRKLPIDPTIAL